MEFNRGRLRKVAPSLAAIALTTTALGGIGLASMRRAPQEQAGQGVPGLLKNLGVALVIVYVAIAVYVALLGGWRRSKSQSARSRSDVASMFGLVAFILLVSWVIVRFRRTATTKPQRIFTETVPARDRIPPPNPKVTHPPTWGLQLGLGLVVVMAVVSLLLAIRNRRRRVSPRALPDRRTLVALSLNDVLAELQRETDPRRAVLLADRGMELALAEHGLPRTPSETANEYALRVADELSLSNGAALSLTRMYAVAHFSPNGLTSVDRSLAIDALSAIRDELRPIPLMETSV